MKVAQNDETNPNTLPTYLSDASNYLNMELSPSGHLSDTGPESGKHSRYSHTLGHTRYIILSCYAYVYVYILFLPPLLSGRPRD